MSFGYYIFVYLLGGWVLTTLVLEVTDKKWDVEEYVLAGLAWPLVLVWAMLWVIRKIPVLLYYFTSVLADGLRGILERLTGIK